MLGECTYPSRLAYCWDDTAGVRDDRQVVAFDCGLDDLDTAVLLIGNVDTVESIVASSRVDYD